MPREFQQHVRRIHIFVFNNRIWRQSFHGVLNNRILRRWHWWIRGQINLHKTTMVIEMLPTYGANPSPRHLNPSDASYTEHMAAGVENCIRLAAEADRAIPFRSYDENENYRLFRCSNMSPIIRYSCCNLKRAILASTRFSNRSIVTSSVSAPESSDSSPVKSASSSS